MPTEEISESDMLTVQLDCLEAEDAMEKAKAKILGTVADKAKARLEVVKKVRDAKYRGLTGGQTGLEEYLVWQKRYDDLANEVILMTGGDKIRLFGDQVAELKRIEKVVKERFRRRAGPGNRCPTSSSITVSTLRKHWRRQRPERKCCGQVMKHKTECILLGLVRDFSVISVFFAV